MEKTKMSRKFWLSLIIFSLVGQVAWVMENMYLNVFIYKEFNASAGAISAMVGASSVAATVTTLRIGALSDKLGKRKLFICGGYLCWGVSIWAFALLRMDVLTPMVGSAAMAASLGISLVIALDCIMTFFGSAANGSVSLYEADLKGPAAIVIGSEGSGMSRLVAENCDFTVSIPMKGKLNSLNASAAAAILLYEAVRQRG